MRREKDERVDEEMRGGGEGRRVDEKKESIKKTELIRSKVAIKSPT